MFRGPFFLALEYLIDYIMIPNKLSLEYWRDISNGTKIPLYPKSTVLVHEIFEIYCQF